MEERIPAGPAANVKSEVDAFRFVVAYRSGEEWRFEEHTVEDFMACSYVPRFKVYFSVPVGKRAAPPSNDDRKKFKRIKLTHKRLSAMRELYDLFKEPE
jgi:hypothetical protein